MVNKVDLYREVANKSQFAITNVTTVFNNLEQVMVEHLRNGEEVRLFGGVTFVPVHVDERTVYVYFVDEERTIPEHNSVKVKFTETFTNKLN